MKNLKTLIFLLAICPFFTNAQIGINATGVAPATGAMLDVSSNNKGVLLPRLSSNASITSPTEGMIFFNTTSNKFEYYDGSEWQSLTSQAAPINPAGTIASTNRINGVIQNNIPIGVFGDDPWEFIGPTPIISLAANQRVIMNLTGSMGRETSSVSKPQLTLDVGYQSTIAGSIVINSTGSTFQIIRAYFPSSILRNQLVFIGTFKPGTAGNYKIGAMIRCSISEFFDNNDHLTGYYQIINE